MKTDIKLAGVGGQGILSIATVIGQAATAAGLHLKQAVFLMFMVLVKDLKNWESNL